VKRRKERKKEKGREEIRRGDVTVVSAVPAARTAASAQVLALMLSPVPCTQKMGGLMSDARASNTPSMKTSSALGPLGGVRGTHTKSSGAPNSTYCEVNLKGKGEEEEEEGWERERDF